MIKEKAKFVFVKTMQITFFSVIACGISGALAGINYYAVDIMWQLILLSMGCALSCLIYPWNRGMTKTELLIRIICHYVLIVGWVLGASALFGWINLDNSGPIIFQVISATIIFVVMSMISWKKSFSVADILNAGLKSKNEKEEEH